METRPMARMDGKSGVEREMLAHDRYPAEKLTRLEALRGMTVDGTFIKELKRRGSLMAAAYASYSNDTGSLEVGKRFDAVIWDDDLFKAADDEILQVKVKATIVDGQLAFGEIKP